MLTETQTSKTTSETKGIGADELIGRRRRFGLYGIRIIPFLATVVQFGLIVLVLNYWQLESLSVARLMKLAFIGFIIHHLLPQRLRLPFFALLSLFAVVAGVGHFGPNVLAGWLAGKTTIN